MVSPSLSFNHVFEKVFSVNKKYFALLRILSIAIIAGMVLLPSVGCEEGNTVVEAASEEELLKTEAELSGISEEEYEEGMNNL